MYVLIIESFIIVWMIWITESSLALDCFRCVSYGGANQYCEDPFHNNYSSNILQSPCWSGRKGRDGLYPATACIKLSGKFEDNGETMIIRDCALDSGSLTTDTELVRMSHCGSFYYQNRYVRGCVQSCSENACNLAIPSTITNNIVDNFIVIFLPFLSLLLAYFQQ